MWLRAFSILFFASVFAEVTGQYSLENHLQQLEQTENYQQVISITDSMLALPNISGRFYYLKMRGNSKYYLGNTKLSLEDFLASLDGEEINFLENRRHKLEINSYVGFCYAELGFAQKSINYYENALELAIELNDSVEVAIAYYNISNSYLHLGQLDQSMEWLKKAYEIDQIRKDTSSIGFDLYAMGKALLLFNQAYEAIPLLKSSIQVLDNFSGNISSKGIRLNYLAKAHLQLNQWDSALYFTRLSMAEHKATNDSTNLAERWVNMAEISNLLHQPEEALTWAINAKNFFKRNKNGGQVVESNHELIKSYIQLHQYSKATDLIEESIERCKQLQLLSDHQKTLLLKVSLLEKIGKHANALEVLKAEKVLNDSIQSMERQRMVQETKVKYEVDKIESEKRVLELENEVVQAEVDQKTIMLSWLGIVLTVILIASAIITVTLVSRNRIKTRLLQAEVNELRVRIKGLLEFKPDDVGIVKEQLNQSLGSPLSDREFEILNLAISDKSNSEIADQIFVSVNTVKFHLKNIYQKLGVADRKEALKYAVQSTYN